VKVKAFSLDFLIFDNYSEKENERSKTKVQAILSAINL
jgi:hypothetical protein